MGDPKKTPTPSEELADIEILIRTGSLEGIGAEAILIWTDQGILRPEGQLSEELRSMAGPDVIKELCRVKTVLDDEKLERGQVICTTAGNMKNFKVIVHGCPPASTLQTFYDELQLRRAYLKAMECASAEKAASIALPLPPDANSKLCCNILLHSIYNFLEKFPRTSLRRFEVIIENEELQMHVLSLLSSNEMSIKRSENASQARQLLEKKHGTGLNFYRNGDATIGSFVKGTQEEMETFTCSSMNWLPTGYIKSTEDKREPRGQTRRIETLLQKHKELRGWIVSGPMVTNGVDYDEVIEQNKVASEVNNLLEEKLKGEAPQVTESSYVKRNVNAPLHHSTRYILEIGPSDITSFDSRSGARSVSVSAMFRMLYEKVGAFNTNVAHDKRIALVHPEYFQRSLRCAKEEQQLLFDTFTAYRLPNEKNNRYLFPIEDEGHFSLIEFGYSGRGKAQAFVYYCDADSRKIRIDTLKRWAKQLLSSIVGFRTRRLVLGNQTSHQFYRGDSGVLALLVAEKCLKGAMVNKVATMRTRCIGEEQRITESRQRFISELKELAAEDERARMQLSTEYWKERKDEIFQNTRKKMLGESLRVRYVDVNGDVRNFHIEAEDFTAQFDQLYIDNN